MIFMIEDTMPHVHIFFHSSKPIAEKLDKENIRYAYEDLTTAHKGVIDFVKIVDGLACGLYSPEELIVAGVMITDALEGYFIKNGYMEKAKYLRVNDLDMVLLSDDHHILAGRELAGCEFDGDNRKLYKLKTRKIKRPVYSMESSHANDYSPEDE